MERAVQLMRAHTVESIKELADYVHNTDRPCSTFTDARLGYIFEQIQVINELQRLKGKWSPRVLEIK
jgi:hypothetical protein